MESKFTQLRGVLVRAGTFEAGGEMVDGVVINCRREDLAALPRLPLYEAVAVVPAAPVTPYQLPLVGSRFVDPERVLGEAESWMEAVEMVEEEDRTEDESYALALWDELRRLRGKARSDGMVFRGALQLLKEAALSPSSAELLAAAARFDGSLNAAMSHQESTFNADVEAGRVIPGID